MADSRFGMVLNTSLLVIRLIFELIMLSAMAANLKIQLFAPQGLARMCYCQRGDMIIFLDFISSSRELGLRRGSRLRGGR